jgi:signal transduction histidine kinase
MRLPARWAWLVPVSGLVIPLGLVLAVALVFIGVSRGDVEALARFLLLSSVPSLAIGYALFYVSRARLRTLGQQITLAYGLGLTIALLNILITARLMFLSTHDLTLLGLLLGFAGALSLSFGLTLAAGMSRSITRLSAGAAELARGNLGARVSVDERGELADLAQAFNRMAARVEEAFARRRDLVAAVSHDLRTPLAAMRAIVEALADDVVSDRETVGRYLQTMRGQIQDLSALIDDLFELAYLDRAEQPLELEPASLRDLISDTLESHRVQAEQKGVRLHGQVDAAVDPVQIHPQRIQRVLGNLMQNAIGYTPAGGTVAITAWAIPGAVQVEVRDTGEGIAPADLTRIFEWFYRGERSRSRATGGSGLGLAIARSIVEAHGGRIWAESMPGAGSTFRFLLPRRRP